MPGLVTEASEKQLYEREQEVVDELYKRAQRQISGVSGRADVHIRDVLPHLDFASGSDNGWTTSDHNWSQEGLNGGEQETYVIDSDNAAENKIFGFFAVSFIDDASQQTTEVILEDGTGSRFERLMVQEAQVMTEGDYALFRNPVIMNEGKDHYIYQWIDDEGGTSPFTDKLVLHGAVAEKAGTEIGTRSQTDTPASGTARQSF